MEEFGKIIFIGETQTVSDKFKKREVAIETEGNYPQKVLFQFSQDKCGILDKYNVGEDVKIHFNLRGRAWEDKDGKTKYFNTLDAWRIERTTVEPGQPKYSNDNGDDLPF